MYKSRKTIVIKKRRDPLVSGKVVISNPTGLHLRPVGLLCQTAMKFKCKVTLVFEESYANAKSVLGVLSACVKSGDEIELVCDGEDEELALETLLELIRSGLGENIEEVSEETKKQ